MPVIEAESRFSQAKEASEAARRKDATAKYLSSKLQFYCLRCGADQFTLYHGGDVQCTDCDALMSNLTIKGEPVDGKRGT